MTTVYRANIATSCDKKYTKFELGRHIQKKSSSESYHPSATKEICEWVRSHPLSKEWTRPLRVLLAVQSAMPTVDSPITQLQVQQYDTSTPQCRCHTALSLLAAKFQRRKIFFQNDISVTLSEGYVWRNIYLLSSLTTPFITPNGIQIHSAVFPQFTHRTDRQTQTDRHTKRQMG